MASERKIPWSKQLGEIGESAIKSYLAYFSNPMKPTFDVGIDFFCEMIEEGSPSLKFFLVQAKGTQHFDEKWGRSFEKEIIDFWLKQPFPVYIIVYDEANKNCYWMSIEEHRENLMEKMKANDKRTVYLTIDRTNTLGAGKNDEFVKRIKEDSVSISFRLNLIQGTPQFLGEGYVRGIPIIYLPDGLIANIRERIRISLNYLINNYLLKNDIPNAYNLCEFLTKFDRSHYDHFVMFGNICRTLGKTEEACSSYEQAIEICQRDKNWNKLKKPSDPSIEDIIASIRKEMKNLECESLMKGAKS
jgi:tetratricopeptide (TPR) repeat protein